MSFNSEIILVALLVGTWANSVLYTIEVIQAAYYYRHFKHDNWMLKVLSLSHLLVSSAIVIDSLSMIANYASVYLYTVTHWGDLGYLQNQYWASHLDPIERNIIERMLSSSLSHSTSLRLASSPLWPKVFWPLDTGSCGRLYHCVEAQLLTHSRTKNKFITLTLLFFIIVATGGAFASAVTIAIFPRYKDRRRVLIPATIWLITEAVTDISIALALLLEFRRVKSSFKETSSLVNRLVAHTIQTGAAGATIALAVLIAFLANNESNGEFLGLPLSIPSSHIPVPTGIAYCLGRVYCLTMLANLNVRKIRNTGSSKHMSFSANPGTRGEHGNQERSEGVGDYGGIHVHRTAVVHIDTPQEFGMSSLKTNPGQGLPDDSPVVEKDTTANDYVSYSSKKQKSLFSA
ncbi:hypothetical protein B0H19DRAFT_1264778 [Mycena capillaripes]|nr:hypothetical protein B0H19DRAFT_1264778 [Mycena capillaripes]